MNRFVIRFGAAAAAMTFAVAVFGGTYFYARFTPSAHVIIDADTAVELTLDRFGRVIVSRTYHGDEPNTLTRLSLTGLPLTQAVTQIVDAAHETENFDGHAPLGIFVCVHTALQEEAAAMTQELTAMVDEELRIRGVTCRTAGMVCPGELLAAGHNKDISPGRLCMISAMERKDRDPIEAVYERMLKYTPRQIKARYGETVGL